MVLFKTSSMQIVIECQRILMFKLPSVMLTDRIHNLKKKNLPPHYITINYIGKHTKMLLIAYVNSNLVLYLSFISIVFATIQW